jgi:hypothetical protein
MYNYYIYNCLKKSAETLIHKGLYHIKYILYNIRLIINKQNILHSN